MLTRESVVAFAVVLVGVLMAHAANLPLPPEGAETSAGWQKLEANPVLGGDLGTCFDVCVLREDDKFRMWYSGGEQYEPNAIGYATSPDGMQWTKHHENPVFDRNQDNAWEKHKVTACQVIRESDWYVMFYIGFADEHTAQIGIARSRDGVTGWQRHPDNPILRARLNKDAWDYDACYKPYAIFRDGRWLLWYNGRKGSVEQIGLATHLGRKLWPQPDSVPASAGVRAEGRYLPPLRGRIQPARRGTVRPAHQQCDGLGLFARQHSAVRMPG